MPPSSAPPPRPFPLLSLPPELRLQIYTHLPTTLHHHTTRHPSEPSHRTTLLLRSFPTALLSVSHQIHTESLPIIRAKLRSTILNAPPRIIDGVSARGEGRMLDAVVRAVERQVAALRGYALGAGPCLGASALWADDGVLRGAISGGRGGRFVLKFVHQVAHAIVYGACPLAASLVPSSWPFSTRVSMRAVEVVKYVDGGVGGMGRYWVLGGDLHALNRRGERWGVVLVCRGVVAAGVGEGGREGGAIVPQRVDFKAYGFDCYVPYGRQMGEEEWVEGWLGGGRRVRG